MKIYSKSVKGKDKLKCDDRILINNTIISENEYLCETSAPRIIGIADGIGSYNGSDRAANYVCEVMSSFNGDTDLFLSCGRMLPNYSKGQKNNEMMGTTFTAVGFSNNNSVMHIGNTRLYSICGHYLKQITTDHTTYQLYLSSGQIEKAENCNKSELIKCIGAGSAKYFLPDIFETTISSGFVLTSDGIHDFLTDDELESLIFSNGDNYLNVCREIISKAADNGSYDDMSIIIAI